MSNKAFTIIGIGASLIASLADILLLYSPTGGYFDETMAFLAEIPSARMIIGHYLGIIFIPISLIGLVPVFKGMNFESNRVLWMGASGVIFTAIMGVVYHGSVIFIGEAMKMGGPDIDHFAPIILIISVPVGGIFVLGFLIFSIAFIILVLNGRTSLPRKIIYFSPLVVYVIILGITFVLPPIGNVLLPAGFNLSMAIFFTGCLFLRKRD